MIRAVISDFGGVLTTPLLAGFVAYQEEAGVSLQELGRGMQRATEAYGEHPLYLLERGEIAEAEFARRLAEQLDGGFDLARLRQLYFERIEPNAPMIRYMAELRERGLRMALQDLPRFGGQGTARQLCSSSPPFPSSIVRSCLVRGTRASSAAGAGCTSPRSTRRSPSAPRASSARTAG